MAVSTDRRNFIFDIEGCDSKDRGEDYEKFERTTSTLALAISDLLIINM